MENWFKILKKHSLTFLTVLVMLLTSACAKDGNPWGIADADPSTFGGNANDGVIKVLAIGNSFSEDALESNFYDLAKATGKTVIVGNMYIGGASLATHKNNVENNTSAYQYRKITSDGVKTTYLTTSILRVLEDEPWDYISFQQASPNSGQLETVQADLPAVYNYVKARATNPNVKYIYHQTWAYAQTSSYSAFNNYNNNQTTMYNAIMNVSQNITSVAAIDMVVPAGTAIQNARTSALGDSFNVGDGYHLNTIGEYVAACTWYEKIFGVSVVGNTYTGGFSAFEVKVAQNAAHLAALKPFEVTSMSTYEAEPIPLTSAVLIDFGGNSVTPSWNMMSSFSEGAKINLKDSLNVFVGMSIEVINRFVGVNTNGSTGTVNSMNMPNNVSQRNFFGSAYLPFGSTITPTSDLELSGLLPDKSYSFSFFGSRAASGNRATKYTVTGLNSGNDTINAASNAVEVAVIKDIKPNANGKITISVTAGVGNDTSNGYFYINAAKITSN